MGAGARSREQESKGRGAGPPRCAAAAPLAPPLVVSLREPRAAPQHAQPRGAAAVHLVHPARGVPRELAPQQHTARVQCRVCGGRRGGGPAREEEVGRGRQGGTGGHACMQPEVCRPHGAGSRAAAGPAAARSRAPANGFCCRKSRLPRLAGHDSWLTASASTNDSRAACGEEGRRAGRGGGYGRLVLPAPCISAIASWFGLLCDAHAGSQPAGAPRLRGGGPVVAQLGFVAGRRVGGAAHPGPHRGKQLCGGSQ